MTETPWEVIALRYATLDSTRNKSFFRWESYGEPDGAQTLDYYFWVLRNGARTVVVDTGFDPKVGTRRGRRTLAAPAEALAAIGVEPDKVETLILTHLHYDHIGNVGLFSDATVLAPGTDLDFWCGPMARRPQFAEHVEATELALLARLEAEGRLQRYDGERELLPGVRMIPLPGHSPGQHGLLVDRRPRPVLLTSDAIHFYEEFERDRPFGIFVDLAQTYTSYDRIRELCVAHDAVLVPGHDPAVVERFNECEGSTSGIAFDLR